jgi:hypothetical protein
VKALIYIIKFLFVNEAKWLITETAKNTPPPPSLLLPLLLLLPLPPSLLLLVVVVVLVVVVAVEVFSFIMRQGTR